MASLGLSAPWIIYYRELEEMFKGDSEVKVLYDSDEDTVRLYVDNDAKAAALRKMIPEVKDFGNVKLNIEVIPSNLSADLDSISADFTDAFKGNSALAFVKEVNFLNVTYTYVVFVPEVVQYYTDDISDIHGIHSDLYANLAKDIFDVDNVFFCTDTKYVEEFGMPLGEWP